MLAFSKNFMCATREYSTYDKQVGAPAFRKSFVLPEKPQKAEILITGLGFYDLFLNGEKITKGYLAPYISNSDHLVYYDNYDLTQKLRKGENVLGVVLGNGMQNPMTRCWDFDDAVYTSSPKFALNFEADCGSEKVAFDASAFKWAFSPITFDNMRSGVHYDARLEQDGWCEAGFDDKKWKAPLKAENPRGEAKLCGAEPIKVQKELAPVSVKAGELDDYTEDKSLVIRFGKDDIPERKMERKGGYIYDFGRNTAGVFRFVIKHAKKGQKISFQAGEYLTSDEKMSYRNISFYPDGYSQRDIYICRGDKDEEVFVPMFVYNGCRYIYVNGLKPEQATAEALTYLVMNSDIKNRAYFNCSDGITNKLWDAAKTSDLANFYYFPTDCPHREKNGWTGDASMSSEHMILTLGVENSWREWLCNIRKAQNGEGALPGIVPTAGWGFAWGNGPAWDSVLFNLPYMTYIYRGNDILIRENAHAMMNYLEYISGRRDEKGLVGVGLGDWAPVGRENCNDYYPPIEFTDSIMVYDMCRKAEVMFTAVGKTLDALYAKTFGDEMRKAIRLNYINTNTMTAESESETAQSMALYYGIFDDAERPEAYRRLVEIVHQCGDVMDVGFLGARVLFHTLSECGESDLAYRMITRREFPSYGYNIEKGLTTLPEMFNTEISDMGSLNHHFFGDINHWFVRHILGINVNPMKNDANEIVVRPEFIASLDSAEGWYDAPAGCVNVKWTRTRGGIKLTVKCDDGVKCTVKLPCGYCFDKNAIFRNYRNAGFEDATVLKTAEVGIKPMVYCNKTQS